MPERKILLILPCENITKEMNYRNLISGILLPLAAFSAFGWGQKGHDTVAFIAENHLTATTKAALDSILGGKSIVYWANWLDNASHTPEYAYSKTWHYKNIDDGVMYEEGIVNPDGDIVSAILEQTALLCDPTSLAADRELALKIVVHLVGDIHQPMHMGHASDRGGNTWKVKYFNRDNNIHSVWDGSLPESAHKWSYTEWQQQIDRATPEEQLIIIADGHPDKWGKETFEICKKVYSTTAPETNISYDYIAAWTPIIEQQFLRGGLRLADLLNSIFDPAYNPSNTFVRK